MDRITVVRRLAGYGGWAALLFVGFATLSPITMRPKVATIDVEHLGAFALIGALLAFRYPQRILALAVFLAIAAAALEFGQTFVPGRHGRWGDALVKIGGAILGIAVAWALDALVSRRPISRPATHRHDIR